MNQLQSDSKIPSDSFSSETALAYGSLCRGLLFGKMTEASHFTGDDLRKRIPKFQAPRFQQYLEAVAKLDRFAQERYGKRFIHPAARWVLDRYDVSVALWGARRPDQLEPINDVMGRHIDGPAMADIDRMLAQTVRPEFMAPPVAVAA